MDVDYFWNSDIAPGKRVALDRGLENPKPLMIKSRSYGGDMYLF
jgi:hypothetical protein